MTTDTDRPALHEFEPYPITRSEPLDHVCRGGCACQICDVQKGDRAVHFQTRDRRRPKVPA